MNLKVYTINFILILLVGCVSNPSYKSTSDDYAEVCLIAERNNQFKIAEDACQTALHNAKTGNLGKELIAKRLFELANIKRRQAKYSEAIPLLKESLEIENTLSRKINSKIGRVLTEIAINYAALGEWDNGAPYLEKSIPILSAYTGKERKFIKQIFKNYGRYFKKNGQLKRAKLFIINARKL